MSNQAMTGCTCAPSTGYYNISGLSLGRESTNIGTNVNSASAGSSGSDEGLSNAETMLSSNAKFQAISAIAVSQDGVINVADRGTYNIRAYIQGTTVIIVFRVHNLWTRRAPSQ